MSGKRPQYRMHEVGLPLSSFFKPENVTSAVQYTPTPSDVFISSYPKCGATWTQNILYLMLHQGRALKPGQNINQFVPHLEEVGKEAIESLPEPRIIKTHLPYNLVPKSNEAKYVYVTRNPKDNCVSYFYHSKGFGRHVDFEDGLFDDFFEAYIEGEVSFGDYFDSVLSWIPHKQDTNVLFMLYEELKLDTENCVKKIGEFLGGPFFRAVSDPAVLENVLRYSHFDAMKATPSLWSSEQSRGSPGFIRKGVIGDWVTHFSKEQRDRMDAKFELFFRGTTAEHFWDKYKC